MTTLTDQQIAALKASIAKQYAVIHTDEQTWCVCDHQGWAMSDVDHNDPLDAEAEMEAIIQDEVKAEMEEME